MTQLFYYGADGTLFLQSSPTSVLSIGLSLEERTSATLERSQLGIIIPVWVRRGSIEVVETITKCEVVETGTVLVQTEGSGYAVKQASEVTEYELAAAATEVEEAVTIGQSSQSVETVQQLAQNTESVEQVSSTTTVAETVYQESSTDVYETTGAETTVTEKVETAYGTPAVETTITEKVETVYETPVATSTEYVNEKVETIETSYTAPVVETSTFVTQVTGTEVVEHTSVEETVAVSEEQFAVEHDVYTEIHEEYQVPVPTPEYTKVDSGPANPWSGDNYDMPADGGYGSGSYPSEEPKYETEKQVVESSTEYVTETYVTEKPSVETATEYVTETKSYVTEAPVVASSTEYVTTTTESTEPSITDTKTSTEYLTEVTSSESYVVEQPAVEISTEYTKTLVAETPVVVSSTEYTTETTYVTGNASTEYATEVSTAVAAEAASEYVTESSYAQVSEQPLDMLRLWKQPRHTSPRSRPWKRRHSISPRRPRLRPSTSRLQKVLNRTPRKQRLLQSM
ncbi:hypothetical protein BJ742DRAFT_19954 [Cladochytrium replicatum]|nr:hypothetical protein BJ742DRAFT_19954 [Cladochytrium replicatum]